MVHNADLINNTYESNGYITYSYISNYFSDLYDKAQRQRHVQHAAALQRRRRATAQAGTGTSLLLPLRPGLRTTRCSRSRRWITACSRRTTGRSLRDLRWSWACGMTTSCCQRRRQALPQPTGRFTPYAGLTNHPSDKNNIGPRIGFAYDVYGDGKTVLRGGYGMYYGRITNGVLLNVLLNTGSPPAQYTTRSSRRLRRTLPVFPNIASRHRRGTRPLPARITWLRICRIRWCRSSTCRCSSSWAREQYSAVSYLGRWASELTNFLDLNPEPDHRRYRSTITISDSTGQGTAAERSEVQLSRPTPTMATQHCSDLWRPTTRASRR